MPRTKKQSAHGGNPYYTSKSCPECRALDDDFMLECDRCLRWFHFHCVGLKGHRDGDPWACANCLERGPLASQNPVTSSAGVVTTTCAATTSSVTITTTVCSTPICSTVPVAQMMHAVSTPPDSLRTSHEAMKASETIMLAQIEELRAQIQRLTAAQPPTSVAVSKSTVPGGYPHNFNLWNTLTTSASAAAVSFKPPYTDTTRGQSLNRTFEVGSSGACATPFQTTMQSSGAVPKQFPIVTQAISTQAPVSPSISSSRSGSRSAMRSMDGEFNPMEQMALSMTRRYVADLPPFAGDTKDWAYFEAVYTQTAREGRFPNTTLLERLRKALRAPALDRVKHMLIFYASADEVMDELRRAYGNRECLVYELTKQLQACEKTVSISDPKIRELSTCLNAFVSSMRSQGLLAELNNTFVVKIITDKLCETHEREWRRSRTTENAGNLDLLALFLRNCVDEFPLPHIDKSVKPRQRHSQDPAPRRMLAHQQTGNNRPIETPRKSRCFYCDKEGHGLLLCDAFKKLSVPDRWKAVRSKKLCSSCLSSTRHVWADCQKKKPCGQDSCDKYHHILLHFSSRRGDSARDETIRGSRSSDNVIDEPSVDPIAAPRRDAPAQLLSHNNHTPGTVLFKILPVKVFDVNGRPHDTFALLDGASAVTLMDRTLFEKLGLSGTSEALQLQWTGGVTRDLDSTRTEIEIGVPRSKRRIRFANVFATDDLLDLPEQTVDADDLKRRYPHLRGIPFPSLDRAKPLIMIGLLHAPTLAGLRSQTGGPDDPVASKTELGWVVYGNATPSMEVVSLSHRSFSGLQQTLSQLCKCDEDLHQLVKGHFTTENFGVMAPHKDLVSEENQRATSLMQKTMRFTEGRYEIGLLWKSDEVKLPNSLDMAMSRLISLEKSLLKNPDLLKWKNDHVDDLIRKGYARKATPDDLSITWDRVWYCPTFIVVNKNKFPPKPRDVADVAAKVRNQSLNSHLLKGPDNLPPLAAGLFKFRESEHAINADVKEMFHQVAIIREDQQCQRFLWRYGDATRDPTIFVMQRMMFGPTCSPTCAQFIKNTHCSKFADRYPEAVDGLVKRTYVDDYFNSHKSVDQAVQVSKAAIEICSSMGMQLVGFQSNSQEILSQLPKDVIKPALVSLDKGDFADYVTKVLGMYWESCADVFTYRLAREELLEKMMSTTYAPTKREVLRTIMRIFDPLGLISNYLIRGRIVLQNIWKEGTDWDQTISEESRIQWHAFMQELPDIENLRIPRRYATFEPSESHVTLVVFVDASEQAFAATAYFRFSQGDSVQVGHVMAKAKVAPTKKLTIPQLELQSAIIGVRLAETIRKLHPFTIHETIFLSDSTVVLLWICSRDYNFKIFVAARVGEILETTSQAQWFKVGTKLNVADDGTKWSDPSMGNVKTRWFQGPDFLKDARERWPIVPATSLRKSQETETLTVLMTRPPRVQPVLAAEFIDDISPRFRANWPSLVRVVAYTLRSVSVARKQSHQGFEKFITPDEYDQAEVFIFKRIQRQAFSNELDMLANDRHAIATTKLAQFSPFLDDNLLRMGSRAQNSRTSYASRNPALLPNDHPLVNLFIYHVHDKNFHMGEDKIIAELLNKAWIVNARSAVRRVKKNCQLCKVRSACPKMPLMGQLPAARLDFSEKPFTHVGLDAFGPYKVKFGRGSVKRYGLIFTCLTFRAVHLEVLDDMSTELCIMAIRNFLVRRGWSKHFYSDNGKNLVGANNRLTSDLGALSASLGEEAARNFHIHWHFIPAYSPWMGGAWERLIQSVKKCMDFVMNEEVPHESVFRNALIEAEYWMNCRPLTHIPLDHEDAAPLTPNSVLFGDDEGQLATTMGVFNDASQLSSKASKRSRHLVDKFLHRWVSDYLPTIMKREKWLKETKSVAVGDIAILVDPSKPKKAWSKCRVILVHPGPDGHVRAVDVEMPDKSVKLNRSVGRIAVLDVSRTPAEPSTGGSMSSTTTNSDK